MIYNYLTLVKAGVQGNKCKAKSLFPSKMIAVLRSGVGKVSSFVCVLIFMKFQINKEHAYVSGA